MATFKNEKHDPKRESNAAWVFRYVVESGMYSEEGLMFNALEKLIVDDNLRRQTPLLLKEVENAQLLELAYVDWIKPINHPTSLLLRALFAQAEVTPKSLSSWYSVKILTPLYLDWDNRPASREEVELYLLGQGVEV